MVSDGREIFKSSFLRTPTGHRYQISTYLVRVRAVLVLGPVRGVGEGLVAAFVFTQIRFLAGVGPEVSLEVLQAGVRFRTALKLQGQTDGQAPMVRLADCSIVLFAAGRKTVKSTVGPTPTNPTPPPKKRKKIQKLREIM